MPQHPRHQGTDAAQKHRGDCLRDGAAGAKFFHFYVANDLVEFKRGDVIMTGRVTDESQGVAHKTYSRNALELD